MWAREDEAMQFLVEYSWVLYNAMMMMDRSGAGLYCETLIVTLFESVYIDRHCMKKKIVASIILDRFQVILLF